MWLSLAARLWGAQGRQGPGTAVALRMAGGSKTFYPIDWPTLAARAARFGWTLLRRP